MSTSTIVNAGFSRKIKGSKKLEWCNVQNISVPLPYDRFSDTEFRWHIRNSTPFGEGWRLEGYCLASGNHSYSAGTTSS